MPYRRRYYTGGGRSFREPQKVQVSIQWDQVTNAAYKLRFDQIGPHWSKISPIIDLIKISIPSSQREYEPETKTWYIGEPYIKAIKDICEQISEFELIYIEKPEQVRAVAFHSKEDDYAEFKRLVSFAHIAFDDTTELAVATKVFRKAAMLLHPDRNPEMASEMSALNEVWTRLKTTYFK